MYGKTQAEVRTKLEVIKRQFYLAMSTGLRRGELLGLRWQDIEGNLLHIRQSVIDQRGKIWISTPKTHKSTRRVAVSPDVLDVLEGRKRPSAPSSSVSASLGLIPTSWLHPKSAPSLIRATSRARGITYRRRQTCAASAFTTYAIFTPLC